ncbi:hypothetical protein PFISCL1PPCAC_13343, partial [Pristionchus fissidentatus]
LIRILRKNKKKKKKMFVRQNKLLHATVPRGDEGTSGCFEWTADHPKRPPEDSWSVVSPISKRSPEHVRELIAVALSVRLSDSETLWRANLNRSSIHQIVNFLSNDTRRRDEFTDVEPIPNQVTLTKLDNLQLLDLFPSSTKVLKSWMHFERCDDTDLFVFLCADGATKLLHNLRYAKDSDEISAVSKCLQGAFILGATLTTRVDLMVLSIGYSLWSFLHAAHSQIVEHGMDKDRVRSTLLRLETQDNDGPIGISHLAAFVKLFRMRTDCEAKMLEQISSFMIARECDAKSNPCPRETTRERNERTKLTKRKEERGMRRGRVVEMVDVEVQTRRVRRREKVEDEVEAAMHSMICDVVRREERREKEIVWRITIATQTMNETDLKEIVAGDSSVPTGTSSSNAPLVNDRRKKRGMSMEDKRHKKTVDTSLEDAELPKSGRPTVKKENVERRKKSEERWEDKKTQRQRKEEDGEEKREKSFEHPNEDLHDTYDTTILSDAEIDRKFHAKKKVTIKKEKADDEAGLSRTKALTVKKEKADNEEVVVRKRGRTRLSETVERKKNERGGEAKKRMQDEIDEEETRRSNAKRARTVATPVTKHRFTGNMKTTTAPHTTRGRSTLSKSELLKKQKEEEDRKAKAAAHKAKFNFNWKGSVPPNQRNVLAHLTQVDRSKSADRRRRYDDLSSSEPSRGYSPVRIPEWRPYKKKEKKTDRKQSNTPPKNRERSEEKEGERRKEKEKKEEEGRESREKTRGERKRREESPDRSTIGRKKEEEGRESRDRSKVGKKKRKDESLDQSMIGNKKEEKEKRSEVQSGGQRKEEAVQDEVLDDSPIVFSDSSPVPSDPHGPLTIFPGLPTVSADAPTVSPLDDHCYAKPIGSVGATQLIGYISSSDDEAADGDCKSVKESKKMKRKRIVSDKDYEKESMASYSAVKEPRVKRERRKRNSRDEEEQEDYLEDRPLKKSLEREAKTRKTRKNLDDEPGQRPSRNRQPVKIFDPSPKPPRGYKKRRVLANRDETGAIFIFDDRKFVIPKEELISEEEAEGDEVNFDAIADFDWNNGSDDEARAGRKRVENWVDESFEGQQRYSPPPELEMQINRNELNDVEMGDQLSDEEDDLMPSSASAMEEMINKGAQLEMPALFNEYGEIEKTDGTDEAVEGLMEDERRDEEKEEKAREEVILRYEFEEHDYTKKRGKMMEKKKDNEEEIIDVVTVRDGEKEKEGEEETVEEEGEVFDMDEDVEEIHEIIEGNDGDQIIEALDDEDEVQIVKTVTPPMALRVCKVEPAEEESDDKPPSEKRVTVADDKEVDKDAVKALEELLDSVCSEDEEELLQRAEEIICGNDTTSRNALTGTADFKKESASD